MATTHFKRNSFFSEEPGTTTISIDELNDVNSIYAKLKELEDKVIHSKEMTMLADIVSPNSAIGKKLKTSEGIKEFILDLENDDYKRENGHEEIEYNHIYLVDIPGSEHGEKYELIYLKNKKTDEAEPDSGKWTLLGSTSISDEDINEINLKIQENVDNIEALSTLVKTNYATKAELQAVDDAKVDKTAYAEDKEALEEEIAKKAYITDVAAISSVLSNAIITETGRAVTVETDLAKNKANKSDVANGFLSVDKQISELSGCIDNITNDVVPALQTKEDAKKELSTVVVDGKEYNGGLIFDQTQFFKDEMVPETDGFLPLLVSISINPNVFDEYGAANRALSAAEAYADSQIDAVVDSLSDYCTVSEANTLSTDLRNQLTLLNDNFILERSRSISVDTRHTNEIGYISSVVETKENASAVSAEVLLSAKTYIDGQIDTIVNGAPEIFDTLKELADQLSSIDGKQGLIVDVSSLKAWVQNSKNFNAQDIINDIDDVRSKQIKKIESIEDLTDIQGVGFGNDIQIYIEPTVVKDFMPSSAETNKLEATIYGVCKDVEYAVLTANNLYGQYEEYCTFISDSDYKTTAYIDIPDEPSAYFKVARKNPDDKKFSILFDVKKDNKVNLNSENLVTNSAVASEFKKYVLLAGGHMSGALSVTVAPRTSKAKTKTTYSSDYTEKEYINLSAGISSLVKFNYPTDEGHFELSSGESYGEAERTFATREWATEKFRTQEQCLDEFVTISDNSVLSDLVRNDHALLEEVASVASTVSNDVIPTLQTLEAAKDQLSTIALNGELVTGGIFLNENQFHISELGNALSIEVDEADFKEDIRIAATAAENAAKSYTDEKVGEVNTTIQNNYGTINSKLNTVNDQLSSLMTVVESKATSLEVAELNEKVDTKADLSSVYTKAQADELFLTEHQDIAGKADLSSVYTKAQANARFLTEHQSLDSKQDALSEAQLSAVDSGVNADWKLSVDAVIEQLQIPDEPIPLENYVSKQELKNQLSSDLSGLAEFNYADPEEMTLSVLIHNVGILQNTFTNLINSL